MMETGETDGRRQSGTESVSERDLASSSATQDGGGGKADVAVVMVGELGPGGEEAVEVEH